MQDWKRVPKRYHNTVIGAWNEADYKMLEDTVSTLWSPIKLGAATRNIPGKNK